MTHSMVIIMKDHNEYRFDMSYYVPIVLKTEYGRVPRRGYADPKKREKTRAARRAKQKAR